MSFALGFLLGVGVGAGFTVVLVLCSELLAYSRKEDW